MLLRKSARASLVVASALALAPRLAGAQQAANAATSVPVLPPVRDTAEAFGAMRARLRELVVAQERFYADHGSYTTDLAALGMMPAKASPTPRVWLRVVQAGGRSWAGDAQVIGLRGRSCVLYVGEATDFSGNVATAAEHRKPEQEGAPTCDQP